MQRIEIITGVESVDLKNKILEDLSEEIINKVKIISSDDGFIVEYSDDKLKIRQLVANSISEFIIDNIESELITALVYDEFFDAPEEEISEISQKVWYKLFSKEEDGYDVRKADLYSEIIELLTEKDAFDLEGFLLFRFKMRILEIKDYVYLVADDILDEEDLDDFARLIKQFVSLQLPKMDHIHIIMTDDDECEIITCEYERINLSELSDAIKDLNKHVNEYDLTYTNLIVSAIMSLLPKNVMLHYNEYHNREVIDFIHNVYGARVKVCKACEFCEAIREGDYVEEEEEDNQDNE